MKNTNIPPLASLISGVLIIVLARASLRAGSVISDAIQALGVVLVIIAAAGFIGKLFPDSKQNGETKRVSKYKFSKPMAYLLSIGLVILFLLNWQNLAVVFWPIILLFIFTLIFNGGLGGKTIAERLPFYLAVIGFIGFLIMIFLGFR